MAVLSNRAWAEDIVQLQATIRVHNMTARKNRQVVVKAVVTSIVRRWKSYCKRHKAEVSFLAWLIEKADLEATYEVKTFELATRRYWALTITRHLLRSEFKYSYELENRGLLNEVLAALNEACGGSDEVVVIVGEVVNLPAGGIDSKVKEGLSIRFIRNL